MSRNHNFHQDDPRRRAGGDGNDGPNPSTGNGDMLKSVYDTNDDGRVNSADHANTATTADDLDTTGVDFNMYYGTNELGTVGFHLLPIGEEAETFLALSDTPADYSGMAGKILKVTVGEDGIEFADDASGVTTFVALTDTPADFSGQTGKMLVVNGAEDALEFQAVPSAGASDFTDLGDVPASYSGQGGKVVKVNVGETGLEFATEGSGQAITTKTTADTGELPSWAAWIADTSGGALSRAMPTSPEDGEEVTVFDAQENAETNNITLTVTGPTTIQSGTIATNGQSKKWRYDSSGDVWDLVFSDAPSGGGGGGSTVEYFEVVVAASKIEEDLTDFPLVLESCTNIPFPIEMFTVGTPSTISVELDDGTALDTVVAVHDVGTLHCRIHVKTDLSSTTDNVFHVHWNKAPTLTANPFASYGSVVPFYNIKSEFEIVDYADPDATFGVSSAGYDDEAFRDDVYNIPYATHRINASLSSALSTDELYGIVGLKNFITSQRTAVELRTLNLVETQSILTTTSSRKNQGVQDTSNGGTVSSGTNDLRSPIGDLCVVTMGNDSNAPLRTVMTDGLAETYNSSASGALTAGEDFTEYRIGSTYTGSSGLYGSIKEVRWRDGIPNLAYQKAEALNIKQDLVEHYHDTPAIPADYLGFGDYNGITKSPTVLEDEYTRATIQSVEGLSGNEYDWIENFTVTVPVAGDLSDPDLYWKLDGIVDDSDNNLSAIILIFCC